MFSMKSLLFVVAVAALGTAALLYRSQIWTSAILAVTLAMVLLAICRALFVPKGRVFWGSFAVVGSAYLAIVSLQSLTTLHYNLPTTHVITYALEKLQPTIQSQGPTTGYATPTYSAYVPSGGGTLVVSPPVLTGYGSGGVPYPAQPVAMPAYNREAIFEMATTRSGESFAAEARAFLWAAQCLWCLLFAFAAGVACSWFYRPVAEPI